MLIEILQGKDLYYTGELIDIDDATAQRWISMGAAQPARCPGCGAQMIARGCMVVCPECSMRKWESVG